MKLCGQPRKENMHQPYSTGPWIEIIDMCRSEARRLIRVQAI